MNKDRTKISTRFSFFQKEREKAKKKVRYSDKKFSSKERRIFRAIANLGRILYRKKLVLVPRENPPPKGTQEHHRSKGTEVFKL